MGTRVRSCLVLLMLLFFLPPASGTASAAGVMMPLRTVLEPESIRIGWDGQAATAQHWDGRLLRVIPGSEVAFLDEREIPLEAPVATLAGVTFVPSNVFESFLGTLLPPYPKPTFTLVRAGDRSWFVGCVSGTRGYCQTPEIDAADSPGWAETPAGTPTERVWLLPDEEEAVLDAFLARVAADLREATGDAYSLAPGAGVTLKTALSADAPTVSLPVERRIGTCVVNFNAGGGNYNNMLNAVRATEYLDGIVVQPGSSFSYNTTVGPWNAERGFVVGYAISEGRYVAARGGGVCRTSTVLYGAVVNAGLTVVERHGHSLPVDYVPVGRDATVSYGRADLQFKNNLPHPVRIEAGGTEHRLQVILWELIP